MRNCDIRGREGKDAIGRGLVGGNAKFTDDFLVSPLDAPFFV